MTVSHCPFVPSSATPLYFPQLADGGGYNTALILLNTSSSTETGTILIFGDDGFPLSVRSELGNPALFSAAGRWRRIQHSPHSPEHFQQYGNRYHTYFWR